MFMLVLLAVSFVPWNWLQREVMFESRVGALVLPQLVEKYNVLADKTRMLPADVPVGVELPHAVLPPPEGYEYGGGGYGVDGYAGEGYAGEGYAVMPDAVEAAPLDEGGTYPFWQAE